jgi:hypothetical protein
MANEEVKEKFSDHQYLQTYRNTLNAYYGTNKRYKHKYKVSGQFITALQGLILKIRERINNIKIDAKPENRLMNSVSMTYRNRPNELKDIAKICAEDNSLSVSDKEMLAFAAMMNSSHALQDNKLSLATVSASMNKFNSQEVESAIGKEILISSESLFPDLNIGQIQITSTTKDMAKSIKRKEDELSAINEFSAILRNVSASNDQVEYASIFKNIDNEPSMRQSLNECDAALSENIVEEDETESPIRIHEFGFNLDRKNDKCQN